MSRALSSSSLVFFFFFNDAATPEISPFPLPDALPIYRDLLSLPCRAARPVPVESPAGAGGLHHLPHPAWLEQSRAAQGADTVAVPGMPYLGPFRPDEQRRQPAGRQRHDRQRAVAACESESPFAAERTQLPQLPLHGPRFESSGRGAI